MKALLFAAALIACRPVPRNRREAPSRPAPVAPAAKSPRPPPAPEFVSVTLRRTGCYGRCPAFTLDIAAGGAMAWHGESFTRVQGDASATATPVELFLIDHAFRAASFASFKPAYTQGPTDCATVFLTYRGHAGEKAVEHYRCNDQEPRLFLIERTIDLVAIDHGWLDPS